VHRRCLGASENRKRWRFGGRRRRWASRVTMHAPPNRHRDGRRPQKTGAAEDRRRFLFVMVRGTRGTSPPPRCPSTSRASLRAEHEPKWERTQSEHRPADFCRRPGEFCGAPRLYMGGETRETSGLWSCSRGMRQFNGGPNHFGNAAPGVALGGRPRKHSAGVCESVGGALRRDRWGEPFSWSHRCERGGRTAVITLFFSRAPGAGAPESMGGHRAPQIRSG